MNGHVIFMLIYFTLLAAGSGCFLWWSNKQFDTSRIRAEMMAARAESARLQKLIDDWNALETVKGNTSGVNKMKAHAAKYQPPKYWQTLGIQPTRDRRVVMAAFRKQAQKHHPDKGGSAGKFQAVFEARNAALKEIGA